MFIVPRRVRDPDNMVSGDNLGDRIAIPFDPTLSRIYRYIKKEIGLVVGFFVFLACAAMWVFGLSYWPSHYFGLSTPDKTLRIAIAGFVSLTRGFRSSFRVFF
jgi:hypothetical protein